MTRIQPNSIGTAALVVLAALASFGLCRPASAREAGRLYGAFEAASRFVELDGIRVHYKSYGTGSRALVFVHCWTCNMGFWSRQLPAFQGKTRVVMLDLPGHGDSDKPSIDYTPDLFARAIDAVLVDAGVERAVLVGHSMGAPVIRQFYRIRPQKTLALVLVDGALRPPSNTEMMDRWMDRLRGPNYEQAAAAFIEGMLSEHTSAELREEIKTSMLKTPQHVAVGAIDGLKDPAIWESDKIDVPMLAVFARSPFWPPDNEQFYRGLAPDLEYTVMNGVSHFLMMEKPEEFNRRLSAFLIKVGLLEE